MNTYGTHQITVNDVCKDCNHLTKYEDKKCNCINCMKNTTKQNKLKDQVTCVFRVFLKQQPSFGGI